MSGLAAQDEAKHELLLLASKAAYSKEGGRALAHVAARVVDAVLADPFRVAVAAGVVACASCMTQRADVLKLHPKRYPPFQGQCTCGTCGTAWPCPTAQALGVAA